MRLQIIENESNRPLLKLEPTTFESLSVIFDLAQTIVAKYYNSKNVGNTIRNENFSNTKRWARLAASKSYPTSDESFTRNEDKEVNITKNDYQKVNNAKLTHHECFICGADNQLIGDGHQCNTDYKNRDGKRSFRGQLYFEKAKSIPVINTVFLVDDKSEAVVDVKCNQSTIRTHMEGKLVDCEPLVISPLAAHSRKPNLQVVLDTGKCCI